MATFRSNLKQTEARKTDINILLLGETGVGKSTFINSFVNYLQHTTLSNAKKSQLISLIPTRFTITDEDFQDKTVEFGFDENEDVEIGNSSTQGARAYVFKFQNNCIRLIDTPGIGDSRGINQDGINFENVLSYINQFEYLHAICFLLKPDVSVINAYFKFCIVHLLSRLEKSAAKNIIFIFTHGRSTFYKPGVSLALLKRILAEIQNSPPHVTIPCSAKNLFCVDNEAFKFLVALKQGIKFGDHETKEFSSSWEKSYSTCRKIISYICGEDGNDPLLPHPVQNTISVNEARRNIINLSKPLADICELIEHNITTLKRHEDTIKQHNLSKAELTENLFVPVIKLEDKVLSQPVTVCAAAKCSEIYTVDGRNVYHYKQKCHNPCYLTNVPKEIIGTPELRNCAAMCGQTCTQCGCDFSAHMHIYYETELIKMKQEDKSVKRNIKTKEDAIKAKNELILKLIQVSAEYDLEKNEISKCMAKFAHFLKENSISVYNDAYLDYLDYLIEREKMLGFQKDYQRINHYMSLKKHYEQEKRILDDCMINARRTNKNAFIITPATILGLVKDLYNLPHTGKQIKKLHTIQQHSVQNTVKSTEYHHPTVISSTDYDSSSSDDEKEDFAILRTLMKEDNLENMRLKLKDIKLDESDEDKVDDRKQKIWNFLREAVNKGAQGQTSETNVNKDKKPKYQTKNKQNNSNTGLKQNNIQNASQHRQRDNIHRGHSDNRYGEKNQPRASSSGYENNNQRHDNTFYGKYPGQSNLYNNQGFNIPYVQEQARFQYNPNPFAMNPRQPNHVNYIPPLMGLNNLTPTIRHPGGQFHRPPPPLMAPNQFNQNFQASGSSNYRGNYNNRRGGNHNSQRGNKVTKRTPGHKNKNRQCNVSSPSSSESESSDSDEPKLVNKNKNFNEEFVKQFLNDYKTDKGSKEKKGSIFLYYQSK